MLKSPSRKLRIESNELYEPLWKSSKRYIISIGGRGGARSFENSQNIIAKVKQTKRRFRAAIMRAIHADIRHSIWQECVDRVKQYDIENEVRVVDTTMEMFSGDNSIHAHGFRKSSSERTAKLKSLAAYTDAYIEEAEEVAESEFQQLDDSLRSEGSQIHLTLNTPAKNHWIIKRWFDIFPIEGIPGFFSISLKESAKEEAEVIFSDHSKNPFLAEEVHRRYEGYKITKPHYYYHMIKGYCPEVLMGKIYSGWQELDSIPHEARLIGRAVDFGFDPDPAAVLDVWYHNGGYILEEKLYQTRLLDDQLATYLLAMPQAPTVADSAEPKAIEGLRRRGVRLLETEKGQGSVEAGIKHVQGLKISFIGQNIKEEYENYSWKRTKDSVEDDDHLGIEDPACANHLMSAARYALTMFVKPSKEDDHYDKMYGSQIIGGVKPREKANPAV